MHIKKETKFGKVPNLPFKWTLHNKLWTYIAENYCTEETAMSELEYNGDITTDEFNLIKNSYKMNICCQYVLDDCLTRSEIEKFYYSNDPSDNFEVCFKHCPLKLDINGKHLCWNGLFDEWFNIWDYDYEEKYNNKDSFPHGFWKDYVFIFDKQYFHEKALVIANLPLQYNIRSV